ncbi:MAG TPA: TMEM175 family protein [Solirubrobacterales bacterium]|nr:TMEM175 family protein [Solirubrobacterales bacterium]
MAESKAPRFDPVAGGHARHRDEAEVEFNRIVAFSDGVFAIAITLLVLGLTVPPHLSHLRRALLNNQDDFIAYAISFAVLGRYWLAHHRFFSSLERFDGRLMTLNLVYLACIALVPFTSQVLGDYASHTEAIVLYAVNMIAVSSTFYVQLIYSARTGLVRPEARSVERQNAPVNLVVVGVFALSIPVAFLSPLAATLMWLTIFFIRRWVTARIVPSS